MTIAFFCSKTDTFSWDFKVVHKKERESINSDLRFQTKRRRRFCLKRPPAGAGRGGRELRASIIITIVLGATITFINERARACAPILGSEERKKWKRPLFVLFSGHRPAFTKAHIQLHKYFVPVPSLPFREQTHQKRMPASEKKESSLRARAQCTHTQTQKPTVKSTTPRRRA